MRSFEGGTRRSARWPGAGTRGATLVRMGTTALVTGASSGIGLEFARLFAAHGSDVALVARSEPKLAALSEELRTTHGVAAHVLAMDLASDGAAEEVVERMRQRGVVIDALVNDAGFAMFGRFAEDDPREQTAMLHVNVLALTELTRRVLPGMSRSPCRRRFAGRGSRSPPFALASPEPASRSGRACWIRGSWPDAGSRTPGTSRRSATGG